MINLIFFFALFITSILGAYAQNDSIYKLYKKSYNDKITTGIYYLDTSNNFRISTMENDQKSYFDVIPDRKEQLGLTFTYRFIDFAVGFSPKIFDANKQNTDSKHFNFSFHFYYKKWMQSFSFIQQKGFHLIDNEIQMSLPKLRTLKMGGTTSYIFNDKFSFKTLVDQNEWQVKSAGSFIPTFSFYYTNLNLNLPDQLSKEDMYVLSLAPSYFYNYVINKKVLVGSGLALGVGLNNFEGNFSALYELNMTLKLAYNTDRFYCYGIYNYVTFDQSTKATYQLNDTIATFTISLGYRYNAPKKVKEIYDRVNKKIGLD